MQHSFYLGRWPHFWVQDAHNLPNQGGPVLCVHFAVHNELALHAKGDKDPRRKDARLGHPCRVWQPASLWMAYGAGVQVGKGPAGVRLAVLALLRGVLLNQDGKANPVALLGDGRLGGQRERRRA
jgi:hypothetical protein